MVGLTYGAVSICWIYARSLFGSVPDVDPCHSESSKSRNEKKSG